MIQPNHPDENSQQAYEQLTDELSACKQELFEKNQVITQLIDELETLRESQQINDKETTLESITSELEKAQTMATMGSWVLEVDTGKVSWTPELYRMFGQEPSCPVPTLEEQKSLYTEKSWKAMVAAVDRTIQEGRPYNIELETIRREGPNGFVPNGFVRSIGEAECDETGRVVCLRGVAQDITDIKQAEAELKLALEKEKAAQVYKDQFLANVSHEIRTPMNGMVGFAGLLREDGLDAETRNEYIDTIESCSNQLLNLIDDIIDIAKIEAGEIRIREKPFNPAEHIQEIANTFSAVKRAKGKDHIALVTSIPEAAKDLELYSDPLRLQQILTNLLSNALKFSERGQIEIGMKLTDAAVEFFVKDEGIGIKPERKKLIFKRFEHLESTAKKYEGTGLGLSISEGLAKLLGAELSVQSEYGVGSIFRLKLPLKEFVPIEGDEVSDELGSLARQVDACTVLVVDDEELNLTLIRSMLKGAPYRILLANDGQEAVNVYEAHPEVDVVLMDIRMPIKSGDVAAREILDMDRNAKIIAQTAYAMRSEHDEFIKLGFVDCISKPFKPQALLATLNKWVPKRDVR